MSLFEAFGRKPKTPRDAEYQASFIDRASSKRVIPRTSDGEPMPQRDFDAVRAADERIRAESHGTDFHGYVGVAPRGSAFRGYAERASGIPGLFGFWKSDLDISAVYDSSLAMSKFGLSGSKEELEGESFGNRGLGNKHLQIQTHDLRLHETDANGVEIPLSMRIEREVLGDAPGTLGAMVEALAALCEDMIGPHVAEYRSAVTEAIAQLSSESREAVLSRIAMAQVTYERDRLDTLKQRMPDAFADPDAVKEFFSARERLWRTRIWKILGSDASERGPDSASG